MGIVTAGDRATEEAGYGEAVERRGERGWERECERMRERGGEREKAGAAATAFRSAPRLVSTIDFPRFFSTRQPSERERGREKCPLESAAASTLHRHASSRSAHRRARRRPRRESSSGRRRREERSVESASNARASRASRPRVRSDPSAWVCNGRVLLGRLGRDKYFERRAKFIPLRSRTRRSRRCAGYEGSATMHEPRRRA